MREKGKIKNYNSKTGSGYIKREGIGDVCFDKSSFRGNPPSKNDKVEFDIVYKNNKNYAKNLKIIQTTSKKSEENHTDSFDISKTKIPKDTIEVLNNFKDVDNFNLKFNKLARFEGDKFKFFKTDRNKIIYQIKTNFSNSFITNISDNYYNDVVKKLNLEFSEFILKPDWRMVIGLGNESVYEVSMTLHHIYGIPYIPGSAIKGVVRNYIIGEKFAQDENNQIDLKNAEKRALENQLFCNIFGCPKDSFYNESMQGKIIFFDVFPMEIPKIEPDVMNVLYPDYYGKTEFPTDYQNPNPIFFLTVKDTTFRFMIGIKNKDNIILDNDKFKEQNSNILSIVEKYLKNALLDYGIGAKTAVGYGHMVDSYR